MPRRAARAAWWIAATLGVTGCAPAATQLIVSIDTDMAVPAQIDRVVISVEGMRGMGRQASIDLTAAGRARPLVLALVPASDTTTRVVVRAAGFLSAEPVVSHEVRTEFVRGAIRAVTILLRRRCAGIVCGDGETCDADGCQSAERAASTLPPFPACAPGMAACGGAGGGECATDLRTTREHCGRCDYTCPADERCDGGVCTGEAVVAVAAGGFHSCALRANGTATCWGKNSNSQLGIGSNDLNPPAGAPVIDLVDAVEISAGTRFSCARDRAGQARCWGINTSGQLGAPVGLASGRAQPVSGLPPVAQVAAGGTHACAREASGQVHCWGSNAYGQLGHGQPTTQEALPVQVTGLVDAELITAGEHHSCAVRRSGVVVCWGRNNHGQLGVESTSEVVDTPTAVPLVDAETDRVVQLSAGYDHTCALRASGRLFCWGRNLEGALATGTQNPRLPPTLAAVGHPILEVAASDDFTCAVLRTGRVLCWGANNQGQLGGGTVGEPSVQAVVVRELRDAIHISTSDDHACAVRAWGGVVCWGANVDGQVGGAPSATHPLPRPIPALP